MKNLIIILIFITNCTNITNAQIIVDISSNVKLPSNYDETGQYYLKDMHNYLDRFVGTWEYVNGNEKFEIILTKVVKYHYFSPNVNLNVYKDAIKLQYKKFVNGNLIYESPIPNTPWFITYDGINLKGAMLDYGRVTVEVKSPSFGFLEQWTIHKEGEYFRPNCKIEKILTTIGTPQKIKFNLTLRETAHLGDPYNNPAYHGQPLFSVPNNIILTKVP